jgi:Mn-dependent DtxR family transcriptional regulator
MSASKGPPPLERVAGIYRAAMDGDNRRAPTKHVAEVLEITYPSAAKAVRQCRQVGLLPKTTPGRASAGAPPRRRKGKK